jgi:hypothetical protein
MRNLTLAALVVLCLAFEPALATKFINFEKEASQVDTVYNDDVFLTGFKVKFDSKVYGDLTCLMAYEIVQTDTIFGNFTAFAQSLQNLEPVQGSFRVFGRRISCNSHVGRFLLLFGQEINIGPDAHIMRDADLWGENIAFQGSVDGDLKIRAHSAVVSGNIMGNLDFQGDSLTINPNTTINGNINYDSPTRANISDAATVNGQVNWQKSEEKPSEKSEKHGFWSTLTWIASVKGYLVWSILSSSLILIFILIPFPAWLTSITFWFILLTAGNLMILFAKPTAHLAESIIEKRLFPSMGLGFIIFMIVPVISIVFFFTILLAPLAMTLTMLFGVAVFVGGVYICLHIGRRICSLFSKGAKGTPGYLCYSIGMSVLLLLSLIPILGYLITFVALLTGVGAIAQALWKPRPESEAQAIDSVST